MPVAHLLAFTRLRSLDRGPVPPTISRTRSSTGLSLAISYSGQLVVRAVGISERRHDLFGRNLLDYVDGLMAMAAPDAVCGEVRFIQSKDFASLQGFSGRDHGGVREIHRMVRVLFHQLEGSRETQAIEEPHRKASPLDELTHPFGADGPRRLSAARDAAASCGRS